MDTLKDFFADLKDRITNPIVSSFGISWIAWNYKIVIALLFYKVKSYDAFIKIVQDNSDVLVSLIYPLGFAIFYTFGFQFIKAKIQIFNAWLLTDTNTRIYNRTKHKSISIEEHQAATSKIEEEKEKYLKLITGQSALTQENKALSDQLKALQIKSEEDVKKTIKESDARFEVFRIEQDQRVDKVRADLTAEKDALIEQLDNLGLEHTEQRRAFLKEKSDLNQELADSSNEITRLRSELSNQQLEIDKLATDFNSERSALLKQADGVTKLYNDLKNEHRIETGKAATNLNVLQQNLDTQQELNAAMLKRVDNMEEEFGNAFMHGNALKELLDEANLEQWAPESVRYLNTLYDILKRHHDASMA